MKIASLKSDIVSLRWSSDILRLPIDVVHHDFEEISEDFCKLLLDEFCFLLDENANRIEYIDEDGNEDLKRRPEQKTIIYVSRIHQADEL